MNQPTESKRTAGEWILKNHGVNEPEYGNGIVHSFGGAHRFVDIANVGFLETMDMNVPKLEANGRFIAMSGTIASIIDATTEFDGAKAIENLEELLKALQPFASHFVPDGMEDIGGGALTVTFKLQVYKDAIAALSKCRKDGGK